MNPFAAVDTTGSSAYPASTFARSYLPNPDSGLVGLSGISSAAMPASSKKHVALVVAVFAVLAVLLFHWHYNRG